MVLWHRIFLAGSFFLAAAAVPVSACGPFLYPNSDLDRFSLLDPGILNTQEWVTFLDFGSPDYGQTATTGVNQVVIHPDRVSETTAPRVSNLVWDYEPGSDPVSVTANEQWWAGYFKTIRHRTVSDEDLQKVLYGPDRPQWVDPADLAYLKQLDGPDDNPGEIETALANARNPKLPGPLRHRWVFWAVRALSILGDPEAMTVFREFCPGPATDLPLARAQGWAASVLGDKDPQGAQKLWVDLFVRWPALRVQTFLSLSNTPAGGLTALGSPAALVARYFLNGRDFSPETLGALAQAEKAAGGDGSWTETVLYSMAEQVEKESGVFALFGLIDPREITPSGLFTGLIDEAQSLVDQKVQPATRTWWLVASYLTLFDGDPTRAAALLDRAKALPAKNPDQTKQTDLIDALVKMDDQKDRDWSPDLQTQVAAALDWGKALNAPDHNRGLYHSVAVLAAQKYLARGQNPQAALAFGLVQQGAATGLYTVQTDDGFWVNGWPSNNPVNLLMDALMTDGDLDTWKSLLKAPAGDLGPLTAKLVSNRFLTDRDITWWQAHRALRRDQPEKAAALYQTLGGDGSVDSEIFPHRLFTYSLDLDPLDPLSGRGQRTVGPRALASVMGKVEQNAKNHPSSQTSLVLGEFWLSLQFSGLPLLFAQPPTSIGFVNGNYEFYGYDGKDSQRSTGVVGTFPLGRPAQTDDWARRLGDFYRNEFTTLHRARAAFHDVLSKKDNPDAEFRALLFLQALDGGRYKDLADHEFDNLPLAQTFRTTCEDYKASLR